MKINWFTVIAQVINFLILVWLLKRYLYKPILDAVDEREKKIKSQLEDAEAKKAEAISQQKEFKQKNDDFNQQKKEMMGKAIVESNEERQKLLEQARNEAKTLQLKLETAVKENQEDLDREIAQKTQHEVFAIAKKALSELASSSLEEQTVKFFCKRLKGLKDSEKKEFISAFSSLGSNTILIQSAFELNTVLQNDIQKVVNEVLEIKTQFKFEIAPELISGIQVSANGFKLSWSISGYLKSLEKGISEKVEEKQKIVSIDKKSDAT